LGKPLAARAFDIVEEVVELAIAVHRDAFAAVELPQSNAYGRSQPLGRPIAIALIGKQLDEGGLHDGVARGILAALDFVIHELFEIPPVKHDLHRSALDTVPRFQP
jgi:hypothetical protein